MPLSALAWVLGVPCSVLSLLFLDSFLLFWIEAGWIISGANPCLNLNSLKVPSSESFYEAYKDAAFQALREMPATDH